MVLRSSVPGDVSMEARTARSSWMARGSQTGLSRGVEDEGPGSSTWYHTEGGADGCECVRVVTRGCVRRCVRGAEAVADLQPRRELRVGRLLQQCVEKMAQQEAVAKAAKEKDVAGSSTRQAKRAKGSE